MAGPSSLVQEASFEFFRKKTIYIFFSPKYVGSPPRYKRFSRHNTLSSSLSQVKGDLHMVVGRAMS